MLLPTRSPDEGEGAWRVVRTWVRVGSLTSPRWHLRRCLPHPHPPPSFFLSFFFLLAAPTPCCTLLAASSEIVIGASIANAMPRHPIRASAESPLFRIMPPCVSVACLYLCVSWVSRSPSVPPPLRFNIFCCPSTTPARPPTCPTYTDCLSIACRPPCPPPPCYGHSARRRCRSHLYAPHPATRWLRLPPTRNTKPMPPQPPNMITYTHPCVWMYTVYKSTARHQKPQQETARLPCSNHQIFCFWFFGG